jgi:hypothetical protein
MKAPDIIEKRLKINKSESRLGVTVAVAAVITVFCLVSAKTLFSQASYNKRVLDARREALVQLKANKEAAGSLINQYEIFQTGNTNIIGGKNSTDANLQPPDGDNARLVLNALPAKYDFPALISSITKILNNHSIKSQAITGTDESGTVTSEPTNTPEVMKINVVVNGAASYQTIKALVADFERSTRPFDVTKVDIKGSDSDMTITLTMDTYYQPALTLNLTTKEIK